jgi:hypothetical protein
MDGRCSTIHRMGGVFGCVFSSLVFPELGNHTWRRTIKITTRGFTLREAAEERLQPVSHTKYLN